MFRIVSTLSVTREPSFYQTLSDHRVETTATDSVIKIRQVRREICYTFL